MLTAYNIDHTLINLLVDPALPGKYTCPICGGEVRLRIGPIKRPHFAHVSLAQCKIWSEPESAQHLTLKAILYRWFSRSTLEVEVEKYLPLLELKPDLLVNRRLAIEVQCSPLSLSRLRTRSQTYRRYGYQVLWLAGQSLWLSSRLTVLQKQLLYYSESLGFYFWELDLSRQILRLKFLIHQDLKGGLVCLVRSYPLGGGDLMEILRTPYKSRRIQLPVQSDRQMNHFIRKQLYYRNPKWMEMQASFYRQGKNLLNQDFSDQAQLAPPGLNLITQQKESEFYQVSQNLSTYYKNFQAYYAVNPQRFLYPPRYYAKMNHGLK